MQLSVEQIIAKVAVQRQKEKHAQKQQELLKQINKSFNDGKNSPQKSRSKQGKQTVKDQPKAESEMIQKYKQLEGIYKRLKIQVSTEAKMDKKYSEVMQKLSKAIQKNNKLQNELDGLRMKQSVILEHEKSLNEENQKRNKSKRWFRTECKEKSIKKESKHPNSKESIVKCSECEACEKYNNTFEEQKGCFQKERFQKVPKTSISPQKMKKMRAIDRIQELNGQISRYKSMISEKESSTSKLEGILQKQVQLIKQYETESAENGPKAGEIRSKMKDSIKQGSGKKVSGTIVKMRRDKNMGEEQNWKGQGVTNRGEMLSTNQYKFSSPVYVHSLEEKTRKKAQKMRAEQNKSLEVWSSRYNPIASSRPYTYIQSIPSQEQSRPQYFQGPYHSPSSSINQTSEFVCGDLE